MTCNDTNNIRLFLSSTTIIIPADLEVAGWKKLLKIDAFRSELKKVDYFIASHQGEKVVTVRRYLIIANQKLLFSPTVRSNMRKIWLQHTGGMPPEGV